MVVPAVVIPCSILLIAMAAFLYWKGPKRLQEVKGPPKHGTGTAATATTIGAAPKHNVVHCFTGSTPSSTAPETSSLPTSTRSTILAKGTPDTFSSASVVKQEDLSPSLFKAQMLSQQHELVVTTRATEGDSWWIGSGHVDGEASGNSGTEDQVWSSGTMLGFELHPDVFVTRVQAAKVGG